MCNDAIVGRSFSAGRSIGLFPRGIMGILLIKPASAREMGGMRRSCQVVILLVAAGWGTGVCDAGPAYTVDDLHLVKDLADRAALAIDNGRLFESLELLGKDEALARQKGIFR